MKFEVEVKDEKASSFKKVLEAMKELKVVRSFRVEAEGEAGRPTNQPSPDERQQDLANQYRDLVD